MGPVDDRHRLRLHGDGAGDGLDTQHHRLPPVRDARGRALDIGADEVRANESHRRRRRGRAGRPPGRRPSSTLTAAVGFFELVLTLGIAAIVAFGIIDQGEVNAQSVTGAVCVYLLLGLAFTFVYGALAALDSGPFFAQGTDGTLATRLYFSYVTLTTVGYGDYTARTNAGHMLGIIEALMGQLYLVTVVALLVSRIGFRRGGET